MPRPPAFSLVLLTSLVLLAGFARPADAANSTVAGAITAYATIQSAGVQWAIAGDDNFNCVVTTEYRRQGDTIWSNAQPLWRLDTGLWRHGEDPGNMLAGSVFFLSPATTYELRLTLSDVDGGSAQQTVSVTTRSEPVANANARVRYVTPGTGGGTGTLADPFRGLAAANAAAAPNDLFLLQPGTYTGKFTPTVSGTATNPIVYRGASAATVILNEGGGVSGGSHCVDLTGRQYVFLENLKLINCLRPVNVTGSTGVAIKGCTIEPVRQPLTIKGIVGTNTHDLFIADNTINMTGDWAGIGRTGAYGTGGYGIEVTGDGTVICYNRIFESWDGINVGGGDGTVRATFNVDIHNNVIDRASDDACQTDAVHQNIRVYRNRFLNSGCALSVQPSFGGPCYMLFNELFNTRIDPFKYHQETAYFGAADPQETSGMLAFHNTQVGSKAGWYESGLWHAVKKRNNLLLGARANMYTLYIPGGTRGDLDYNGYSRQQNNIVKYNGTAYSSLPAFYAGAGMEQHGIEVTLAAFVQGVWPANADWEPTTGYGPAYAPTDFDLQLSPTSVAADRGQVLANINDGFTGAAPDLGVYERGKPVPWYGPRTSVDVSPPAAITDLRSTP